MSLKTLPLALVLAFTTSVATAELPPSAYRERQAQAPEHLEIRVLSVKAQETHEPRLVRVDVTAEAKVQRVHRSQSGLKEGEFIRIRYAHRRYREPIAGPSEVPILKAGETCPAFLIKDEKEKAFAPAAGGHSFEVVK